MSHQFHVSAFLDPDALDADINMDAVDLDAMARRLFDFVLAAAGLIFLAPVMALVALAVFIESGGPVFYSQVRLGQGGKRFQLHKFRKFRPAISCGPAVTLRQDGRMTRVGLIIERTKLDELPQLWNVLLGEMSVVGPRPESLAFADCYGSDSIVLLEYKPGIFGPCQVLFRDESHLYQPGHDPEDFYRRVLFPLKAHADLSYFRRRCFISDLWWAACSIAAIVGLSSLCCRQLPTVLELDQRIQHPWANP